MLIPLLEFSCDYGATLFSVAVVVEIIKPWRVHLFGSGVVSVAALAPAACVCMVM